MRVDRTVRCEGPDCSTFQSTASPEPHLPVGWVRCSESLPDGASETAYCGWDCVLKAAAQIDPPETFDFGGAA